MGGKRLWGFWFSERPRQRQSLSDATSRLLSLLRTQKKRYVGFHDEE